MIVHECEVEGCVRPRITPGRPWCKGHLARYRKTGDPGPAEFRLGVENAQLWLRHIPFDDTVPQPHPTMQQARPWWSRRDPSRPASRRGQRGRTPNVLR